MALSQAQMQKYGLSASNATASDFDKGIVSDGRQLLQHRRLQARPRAKLDQDGGAVFSSSLEADSGISRSSFNTANDVEGALKALDGERDDGSGEN